MAHHRRTDCPIGQSDATFVVMDAFDDKILGALDADARTSFSALGRLVGLSTNAVAARVRRLERDGVIAGYTVRRGPAAAAERPRGLEVFVDVRLAEGQDSATFPARIASEPAVVDAVHVTGAYDYLLHAYVVDTAALDALLRRLKSAYGASHTQTRLALRPS